MGVLFDLIVCVILVLFVLFGFRKGIVRSAVELVGFLAALIVSARFSGRAAAALLPVLAKWFPSVPQHGIAVQLLAAAVVFVLCEAVAGLIASAADHVFRLPVLRQINALLGGALGLLKGAAAVLLICAAVQGTLPDITAVKPDWKGIEQSRALRMTRSINPMEALLREAKWNEVKWDAKQKQKL